MKITIREQRSTDADGRDRVVWIVRANGQSVGTCPTRRDAQKLAEHYRMVTKAAS